jgi:hypothetical protein
MLLIIHYYSDFLITQKNCYRHWAYKNEKSRKKCRFQESHNKQGNKTLKYDGGKQLDEK